MFPSEGRGNLEDVVYVAVLLCSDERCADRLEEVGSLAELDTLACECGWGCLVLGWPRPL